MTRIRFPATPASSLLCEDVCIILLKSRKQLLKLVTVYKDFSVGVVAESIGLSQPFGPIPHSIRFVQVRFWFSFVLNTICKNDMIFQIMQ
jgi:hypothetical protein